VVQVDGSVAAKQGIRFVFQDGSRIIFRISVSHAARLDPGCHNGKQPAEEG
jgi:phosphoglucomutase